MFEDGGEHMLTGIELTGKRLDHLILVMTLALYWAVSTGMWDVVNRPTPAEENSPNRAPATTPER